MNFHSARKGPRAQRRGGRKQASGRIPRSPPEFIPTFATGHKFRFNSASQNFTALPITRAMLLNLFTVATTTTNQFRLLTAIKLNRITMWCTPPVLGGSAQASAIVEWVGLNAPSTIHSDHAMGVVPAMVRSRPPRDGSNRWWSISGNNETEKLVILSGSVGTIIDVEVSVRFADDEAGVAGENGTAASSSVGAVYYNYLDGFVSKLLAPDLGVHVLP